PVAVATAAAAAMARAPATSAANRTGRLFPEKYAAAAALPKPPGVVAGGNGGGGSSGSRIMPSPYVDSLLDPEVDALVTEMLSELFHFQERARLKDPMRAKRTRRLVLGLREVLRGLKARKVKMVIVAPDIDQASACSLDDKVSEIVAAARADGVAVVFALSKRRLGRCLGKTIKVSVVGVYGVDGAIEQFRAVVRRL
ncbi:unnamed protein product, partial [Phaeothamnion confervicola]